MTEHTVKVLPKGHQIAVPEGEKLMATAQAQGWEWPTVCNGEAACGVCMCLVEAGMEHTSEIGRDERVRLDYIGKSQEPRARLACQMRIYGPVTVFKRGVRRLDPETAVAGPATQEER